MESLFDENAVTVHKNGVMDFRRRHNGYKHENSMLQLQAVTGPVIDQPTTSSSQCQPLSDDHAILKKGVNPQGNRPVLFILIIQADLTGPAILIFTGFGG